MNNESRTTYYKNQRDVLVNAMLKFGVSRSRIAELLGVSTQAISIQFPTTRKGTKIT